MLKNKIIRTHLFQMLKGENVDFPFYTGIELSEMGEIKYMVTPSTFTTSVTSGAGTAKLPGAPEFNIHTRSLLI